MRRSEPNSLEMFVLGDINADVIGRVTSWPQPGQESLAPRLELHCGGVGANCALALRRWNVTAHLAGCVGQDVFGESLVKILAANGVDLEGVRRTRKAMTGMLYINVTPDGQRTFFGSRGANQLMSRMTRRELGLMKQVRAASLMGYSFLDKGGASAARQIIAAVHRNHGWVSLDIGMEPSQRIPEKILQAAKSVDLLFVSSDEAAALTGCSSPEKAFDSLLSLTIPTVVMKLGKRGCLIADSGNVRHVPPFPIRAVDSTGAGDAFTAAFLHGQLRGWPVGESALAANAAGAAAASVVGAGDRLPTQPQIVRLLRSYRLEKPWDDLRLRLLRRLT